jgi:hypothetical protein
VMTWSSPRVSPGVPAAGVEGIDRHVLTANGQQHTGYRARELLDKVDRCHLHGSEFFHEHVPIRNAGHQARERAGGGAEA